MKIIEYRDDKNWIQTFCHLLITREGDRNEELIAAGLIGIDQSTRAIAAHAIKGDRLQLSESGRSFNHDTLDTDKYNYRFVSKGIGKLNHTILLHKSAVDEQLAPGMTRTILVPEGGNITDIFLHRFATDFNMPHVAEWAETIWNVCRHEDLVTPLKVWTDGNVEAWRDVEAFEMSVKLTEEKAKEIISNLLRCGDIELPEGLTEDAPALSDVLVPDEKGEVHVIDYLQSFAPHLAASVEEIATPLHDLDKPIHPAIAKMNRVPFPSQAHTAQAILKGFMHSRGVLLASDMGTGKSLISLAVAYVFASIAAAKEMALKSKAGFSVLMLVPAITIPKWIESEIKRTIPNAKITVFDNWKTVTKYWNEKVKQGKKDELEFVFLSRDTAKLGTPKTPALIYHERKMIPKKYDYEDKAKHAALIHDCFTCPDCGSIQVKTTKIAQKAANEADNDADALTELKLGFDDLASGFEAIKQFRADGTVKEHRRVVFKKSVTDYHCTNCGHNLMRTVVPEREKVGNGNLSHRRLQPAWFIEKYMSGWFDFTIIDELHQYKASSGQGEAMGMIVGASKRVLGLTGTLSDGKASSLYYLLWRLAPGEMLADGIDHKSLGKFIHLYGAVEQKGRYSEDDIHSAGGSTERKVVMNPPKEIPGLSPKLFVNHLADKTVFLELPDLGLPLVKLEEKPVFVDMDEEHAIAYRVFHNDLETEMKKQYVLGNPNAFAKFIPSVVNAANQPHKSQTVWVSEDSSISFYAPIDEFTLSAKERRLLEDIQQEIEEGRRCVVYVRYSGKSGQDERISEFLKRAGIKVRVLKASVSPEDRVDWLEKAVEDNVEVVISNAKLVEVGLDLLAYPTLLFYQLTDEVSVLRQAARRAWRIGQYSNCRIRYYIYNATYEMVQFRRMMAKRSHALLLEGRLDKSELASFAVVDGNSASTYSIANCLGNVDDLSARWQTLADKDIPKGIKMLDEAEFKVEIGLAMKRLAQETRRIAGVPEPAISAEIISFPSTPTAEENPEVSAEFPLFAITANVEKAPVTDNPHIAAKSAEPEPQTMTYGEWRKSMGMVEKAKVKRNRNVSDNQVMLFAL